MYADAEIIHTESSVNVFSSPGKNTRLLPENCEFVLHHFCVFLYSTFPTFSLPFIIFRHSSLLWSASPDIFHMRCLSCRWSSRSSPSWGPESSRPCPLARKKILHFCPPSHHPWWQDYHLFLWITSPRLSFCYCRLVKYCATYSSHDPFLSKCLPSNPWLTDDVTYWTLNMPKSVRQSQRRWNC